jgi:hypothetical protein
MKLSKLDKNFQFHPPISSSLDLIRLKYSKLLNLFDYVTDQGLDTISFQKKQINPDGSEKYKAFNVLREGSVSVMINSERTKLFVRWSIKLDSLYFFSVLIGIALVVLSFSLFSSKISTLLIVFASTFGISFCIGYIYILAKIEEINFTCLSEE